jgi:hypothetical protein
LKAVLVEPFSSCINAQEYLNIGIGDRIAIVGAGPMGCMHAELAVAIAPALLSHVNFTPSYGFSAAKTPPEIPTKNTPTAIPTIIFRLIGIVNLRQGIVHSSVKVSKKRNYYSNTFSLFE